MRYKSNNAKKAIIKYVLLFIGVIVFSVLFYQGARWVENRSIKPESRGDHLDRYEYDESIVVDNITYRKRKNITTILFMGIDRDSSIVSNSDYRNGGQADFLRLIAIDNDKKQITQIQIDRDTMTPITILGVLGDKSGIRTSQICLSHGFGDGNEQSCELAANAVSNLLLGTSIDFYLSMDMDGIPTMNDMLGGITVKIEDDFTKIDSSMIPGSTLTLTGKQAEIFVRSRQNVGDGTNHERMRRQQQYMSQLSSIINKKTHEDKNFIGTLYDALEEYLITNLSRGQLINEAWTSRAFKQILIEPEGNYQLGNDGFIEFHINEEALKPIILELFYEKMN